MSVTGRGAPVARICNGLSGETLLLEDQDTPGKKVYDLVVRRVCECWQTDAADLIVLEGGGSIVSQVSGHGEEHERPSASARDVFVFFRSALATGPEATEAVAPFDDEEVAIDFGADAEGGVARHPEDELLRLRAESGDPAVESFRSNIAEARRYFADGQHAHAYATREEARTEVQRSAARAVLDNLTSQKTTCSRSLALLLQKFQRVQERIEQSLGMVETSITALGATGLHPATRKAGQETLADVVPYDRIRRFTENMQAEWERLGQRLEKLRQWHTQVQTLCDQVVDRTQQFPQEDSVASKARSLGQERAHIEEDLIRELCGCVPRERAASTEVLEHEKRSSIMLEGIKTACSSVRDLHVELRGIRNRQRVELLQRVREVSYIQSQLRDVERQAVLLEEEINAQRGCTQQLAHLRRMPKAYQKMLTEIARRRHFRSRYVAQGAQARSVLAKMMEDENVRRREFMQRYGCHLPADLLQGLGSLVPLATIDVPEFDTALPEVDWPAPIQSEALAGGLVATSVSAASGPVSSASSTAGAGVAEGRAEATADSGIGASGSTTAVATGRTAESFSTVAIGGSCGGSGEEGMSQSSVRRSAQGEETGQGSRSSGCEARSAQGEETGQGSRSSGGEADTGNGGGSGFGRDSEADIGSGGETGSGRADALRMAELEAQNRALEERVRALVSELQMQRSQTSQ